MNLKEWNIAGDCCDHLALAQNFERIDRHSGTVCGCIKRCVYDGGTGYKHREMQRAGEEPRFPELTW